MCWDPSTLISFIQVWLLLMFLKAWLTQPKTWPCVLPFCFSSTQDPKSYLGGLGGGKFFPGC